MNSSADLFTLSDTSYVEEHRDQTHGELRCLEWNARWTWCWLLSACSSWIFREGMLGSVALFISRMPILRVACCDSWRSFPVSHLQNAWTITYISCLSTFFYETENENFFFMPLFSTMKRLSNSKEDINNIKSIINYHRNYSQYDLRAILKIFWKNMWL